MPTEPLVCRPHAPRLPEWGAISPRATDRHRASNSIAGPWFSYTCALCASGLSRKGQDGRVHHHSVPKVQSCLDGYGTRKSLVRERHGEPRAFSRVGLVRRSAKFTPPLFSGGTGTRQGIPAQLWQALSMDPIIAPGKRQPGDSLAMSKPAHVPLPGLTEWPELKGSSIQAPPVRINTSSNSPPLVTVASDGLSSVSTSVSRRCSRLRVHHPLSFAIRASRHACWLSFVSPLVQAHHSFVTQTLYPPPSRQSVTSLEGCQLC